MQIYSRPTVQAPSPDELFVKWAAVEVTDLDVVPEGMQSYSLAGGFYAVFDHRGPATDTSTIRSVFGEWLPNAEYVLDNREHFEVLPENYDPFDPDAHEEYWIPVRPKNQG